MAILRVQSTSSSDRLANLISTTLVCVKPGRFGTKERTDEQRQTKDQSDAYGDTPGSRPFGRSQGTFDVTRSNICRSLQS